MSEQQSEMSALPVPLERDGFVRDLVRELSGLLEDMVGLEETAGFVSVVGQRIGTNINQMYCNELKLEKLDRGQVAQVLKDLKLRIQGQFTIEEEDDKKIVLRAKTCPFAEKVIGRSSLCMMTSNVFGTITADNLGYAKVDLEETIARGDAGCKVVVYLDADDAATQNAKGREYYESQV